MLALRSIVFALRFKLCLPDAAHRSVSLRINFNPGETELGQACGYFGLARVQQIEILWLDFNSSGSAMMTDAHLTDAQCLQKCLGAIDLRQRLERNRCAVRNARREAGERRLVPGRQTKTARQFPDFDLVQTGVYQRRDYPTFDGRRAAWAAIAQVIKVEPIENCFNAKARRKLTDARIHFRLAEIASVRSVGQVILIARLKSANHFVPRSNRPREIFGLFQFAG